VGFHLDGGEYQEWYPSLIAVGGEQAVFGLKAQALEHDPDWLICRSFKRLLSEVQPRTHLTIGKISLPLEEWLTQYMKALREDLLERSSLEIGSREQSVQVMAGIPANANSNQRFLTMEAYRRAGFDVLGLVNEPSAAGVEYAHRYRRAGLKRRREYVLVYDLGGGTFDASVIRMMEQQHEVVSSEGISRLGGDDFDQLLMDLTLSHPSLARATSQWLPRTRLLNLCREAKESITPNTRKITIDLGQISLVAGEVLVPVSQFYDKCRPLIDQTIQAALSSLSTALGGEEDEFQALTCVYLVGGSCELPVLARSLREHFGKRVRRSPYPSASTAIGLAIIGDQESGYTLGDQFNRHFGVWRENEEGREIIFDPIFVKQTQLPLPGQPPLKACRRYHPAHNLGHFRFIECSHLRDQETPAGDIISWDEIFFPFDPRLASEPYLETIAVERWPDAGSHVIEEIYRCDAQGLVDVTISNQTTGLTRTFRIRRD
jgi:molecular chaperone DnaK (HSP70)